MILGRAFMSVFLSFDFLYFENFLKSIKTVEDGYNLDDLNVTRAQ